MADEDLRRLERQAQLGDADAERRLLLARARTLPGLDHLDVQTYTCNGQSNRIARFRHSRSGLVFCLIPGGRFVMGSPESEDERSNCSERPQHDVQVPSLLLAQTPCTQEAWERLEGENRNITRVPSWPVTNASWNDIQSWLDQAGDGLRLPSEAEWEYACRAGTQTPFHLGETITLDQVTFNPRDRSPLIGIEPSQPGFILPNAYGLFDMHGNVLEWCQDTWHDSYADAPTDGSAWETGTVEERVCRGGSSSCSAWLCRSASRHRETPDTRGDALGFRPAVSLP